MESLRLGKECYEWHKKEMMDFAKWLAENCDGLYSDVGYYKMDGEKYSVSEIYDYYINKKK